LSALKRAKSSGCPAFKASGRVELAAFLRWFFRQPPPPVRDTLQEFLNELDASIARYGAQAAREK